MTLRFRTLILGTLVALATHPTPGFASGGSGGSSGGSGGSSPSAAPAAESLAKARELTKARQFPAALAELRRINATGDPMWNNLMGYALRESDPPDLAGAESYYAAALRIDPRHRPTLEYLGELRLQQGDLEGAQRELAALKQASFFKSEEYKDLEKAIARYKAAGNKYVDADS
jgi:tetratricopeptide (TPR) repeat protein